MNKLVTVLVFVQIILVLAAQEGPAYRGTRSMTEKEYSIRHNYGANEPFLETISNGLYDEHGYLLERRISRGNRTYLGRIAYNRSLDPLTREVVHYNHTNQITERSVEIQGSDPRENTSIIYDSRGRILSKTSTRVFHETGEQWTMYYNQVGYIQNYIRTEVDSLGKIVLQEKFNYFDDLTEKHFYLYNETEQLTDIYAMSVSDTLLFRRSYVYDDAGNLCEENLYDHKEVISETQRYSYDDRNRLLQKSLFVWNPRYGGIPVLTRQWDYSYER